MKIFKRFIFWSGIAVILFFIGVSVFIQTRGRGLVQDKLTTLLKRPVEIGGLSYRFPLGMQLKKLRVGDMLTVGEVRAQLKLSALLNRKIDISSISLIKPFLTLDPSVISQISVFAAPPEKTIKSLPSEKNEEEEKAGGGDKDTAVSIDRILVEEGTFQYIQKLEGKGFSFTLDDIFLKCEGLDFPLQPSKTTFQITARFLKDKNPFTGTRVETSGWVNIVQRNMDGQLSMIDAAGKTPLSARVVSKNNDLSVQGDVDFTYLVSSSLKAQQKNGSDFSQLIRGGMKSMGIEFKTSFSFKTKMDDFKLSDISISGNIPTDSIKNWF